LKPASFAYHRAASVGEALELLAREGEDAKVIAGGQSLVPLMAFRLARPSALIDINRIAELRYVRRDGDALRIGALATHRDIETNAEPGVLEGYSILPRAARFIGHYPIRTRGTFGGSIAHADPTSEWCMLARLLDAEIVVTGAQGSRTVASSDFFRGVFTTALGVDEVVTEVRFPAPAPRSAISASARSKERSASSSSPTDAWAAPSHPEAEAREKASPRASAISTACRAWVTVSAPAGSAP